MHDAYKLASTFLGSVTLIMALVLMVSILSRVSYAWMNGSVVKGLLFSFALFMTMSDPIPLAYGGIFDMRGLLIGTAVALFGPVTGVMALVTGLSMRWGIGGTGVAAGFVGMLLAFAGGVTWRWTVKNRSLQKWKKSCLLGVLITVQLGGIFLAPSSFWGILFLELTPYTLATNVIGVLMINHLTSGELSFLSEAESSKIDATTDHLTGLLNRRGLDLIYPSLALLKGPTKGRALLYFDIDRFKSVNDTHGHAVGDAVLKFVTNQISQSLRPNDVFARLGGDEFAVILSRIDAHEAKHIAKRCCEVVKDAEFKAEGEVLDVSVSVGAIWMLHHTEIDKILDHADQALYEAKQGGRNRVVFKRGTNDPATPDLAFPA
ncbi:diguanylate cyclase [Octadecabacter sp.]|nr:diguanylate cyclase [Octadecabacter sp.]